MLDAKIIQLLRCPIDKTPLTVADESVVIAVNQAIQRSEARDRRDQLVREPIEAGLCSGPWLYPIRGGIPTLLADEAIAISDFADCAR